MPDSVDAAHEFYRSRVDFFRERVATQTRLDRRLSRARLALFLAVVGSVAAAGTWQTYAALWYSGAAIATIAFVWAARVQERIAEERVRSRRLMARYRHALARLERRWSDLPEPKFDVPVEYRGPANDLDIFGHGSVFHLINETQTHLGRQRLASWLLEPAGRAVVARRFDAASEIAAAWELREELFERSSAIASSLADPQKFIEWSESPGWFEARPVLRWLSAISSAVSLLASLTWLLTHQSIALTIAVGAIALNSVILLGWGGRIYAIFNQVSTRHREASRYRELFELLRRAARVMQPVREWLEKDESHAFADSGVAWARLEAIMKLAGLRHAGMASIIHAALQPTLLWDFHVCRLLDRWKRQYGAEVRSWFDGWAALEALSSLSILHHDYPDWCRPAIESATDRWIGKQVGHPLLRDDVRVCNDVTVGPPGSVLLVTGSNMSGKSTLLRAIGVNSVLAQAGAPVCAASLSMPSVILATSMRVQDSLEEGVSFYLAELKRLKEIVDLATKLQADSGSRRLLYLLDEILQGTNSRERHIAVAHVVSHLVEAGAIGAISTHDLDLARHPLLRDAIRAVHFRESFREGPAGREMVFDYRLRDGVATTTNALKLLEIVGLADGSELADESEGGVKDSST